MATRSIGTKLTVSGEREYKQAISEVNSSLGVLKSEMKKVSAEFQANADSLDALKAKNDVYERQLLTQKEKVETLREALANAAQEYGEADARTMKWQKALNEAEAEVYNTEAAIKKNNEAIENYNVVTDDATKKSLDLGNMVDKLAGKFGINLPKGATDALNGIQGFSSGAVVAIGAVAAAVAALIDAEKRLIDMTNEAASAADDILTNSTKYGLSTSTVQELQYAAELIDVSFETMSSSMTKLKRNMDSARDGNEKMAEAFANLGVSVTNADGSLRNTEEVFYEAIDALGEIGNETERDIAAMDIFGKSAAELNPLIVNGSDTLRAYANEAHEVGYVMSTEMLESLGAVDDSYQRLQKSQESVRNHLAAQFAPALKNTYDSWNNLITSVGRAFERSGIVTTMGTLLQNTVDMLSSLGDMLGVIPLLQEAMRGLSLVVGAVAQLFAVIADAADMIKSIFSLDFKGFTNSLGFGYGSGNANHLQKTIMQQNGTWNDYAAFYGRNAGGSSNWRGGMTLVGENGPELVSLPGGSGISTAQATRLNGGNVFNITIDAKSVKEFNDIVEIAQNARMTARMA